MAIITANAFSTSLMRTITFTAVLPGDKVDEQGRPFVQPPYKTIYLLHGILGSHNDWLTETRIAKYAQEHNIAIVMPAGENLFYVDQGEDGVQFGQFIGKELVALTRRLFPLSTKRSDTFIAGLSMGGYGAVRNGLKYSEQFSAIGSFSGAFITDALIEREIDSPLIKKERRSYIARILGEGNDLKESDKNPKFLIDQCVNNQQAIPDLFIACGTEDILIEANRDFVSYIKQRNVPVTYIENKGDHNWTYWNWAIQAFINWLEKMDQTNE